MAIMAALDPRMTFESFVVGPENRLASAAARRAADSPGASYNPLFLYSSSGLGKSHILHAMAHHADERADTVVENILQYVQVNPETEVAWFRTPQSGWWYWWNNDIETNAWILRALLLMTGVKLIIQNL